MPKTYAYITEFEDFQIDSSIASLKATVCKQKACTDVTEYAIDLSWDASQARANDSEMAVLFMLPCSDLQYMWHPDCRPRRVLDADWRLNIHSMLTDSAPLSMLFNGAGLNTYTFATNEVRKVTSVQFGVHDEGGSSHISGKIAMGLKQFDSKEHMRN